MTPCAPAFAPASLCDADTAAGTSSSHRFVSSPIRSSAGTSSTAAAAAASLQNTDEGLLAVLNPLTRRGGYFIQIQTAFFNFVPRPARLSSSMLAWAESPASFLVVLLALDDPRVVRMSSPPTPVNCMGEDRCYYVPLV
jgi:hypothetical protein